MNIYEMQFWPNGFALTFGLKYTLRVVIFLLKKILTILKKTVIGQMNNKYMY